MAFVLEPEPEKSRFVEEREPTVTTERPTNAIGRLKQRLLREPPADDPRGTTAARYVRAAGDVLLPGNWTELALLLASGGTSRLVTPLVERLAPSVVRESPVLMNLAKRGARAGASTAVGAGVGAATGEGAGQGAKLGGVAGLSTEALNSTIESIARATGTSRMEKIDAKNLGAAIKEAVAAFGQPKTTEDLYKLAMTSGGQAALNEARTTALKGITDKLKARVVTGGHPTLGPGARRAGHAAIEVPALRELNGGNALMTLEEAGAWLSRLGSEGWLLTQKVKEGLDASAARALRGQARNEIVQALDGQVKGLGKEFDQALKQYSKGQTILDFLQQPGIFTKDGRLDMNAVREGLGAKHKATQTETFAQQLEHRLTPEEVQRFYGALFRGGPMTGRDAAGAFGLHFGVGLGGVHGGITRPRLPSFTGDPAQLPWWARPGRLPVKGDVAGRVPLTFGTIGLLRENDE
jgi:hypothetical protein